MTIYIDNLIQYNIENKSAQVKRVFAQGSCHLFTDRMELDELHVFAQRIGLKREWFQEHKALPHYDLNAKRREAAIKAGAVEADRRKVVECMRMFRSR